jgi:uncharacterized protein (DUF924 family)
VTGGVRDRLAADLPGLPDEAASILTFWFGQPESSQWGVSRHLWFSGGDAIDTDIRQRFAGIYVRAEAGDLASWCDQPATCLAHTILYDQFSRNMFRGEGRAFARDADARALARHAVLQGWDRHVLPVQRWFFYLPFEHSEDLADQDRSVGLFRELGEDSASLSAIAGAIAHQETVFRFARYPLRNDALGRESTAQEKAYQAASRIRWGEENAADAALGRLELSPVPRPSAPYFADAVADALSDGALPPEVRTLLALWFLRPGEPGYGARRVVWFEQGRQQDDAIRRQFADLHADAVAGRLDDWAATPATCLALIVLLDQVSRHLYRGTLAAHEADAKARGLARWAIMSGFDRHVLPVHRWFFFLPFEHSEDLADQDLSLCLFAGLGEESEHRFVQASARHHHEAIAAFGRFPWRNAALGRTTTTAESSWMETEAVRWG